MSFLSSGDGFGPGGDLGAAALVDVWASFQWLRVGGAIGIAGVSSDGDVRSRVIMPFGLSVAADLPARGVGLSLRMRIGGWGGATDQGLDAGAWLAPGAHLRIPIGPEVSATVGLDLWYTVGHFDAWTWAPGIGLTWSPVVKD